MSNKLHWKVFLFVLISILVLTTGAANAIQSPTLAINYVSIPASSRSELNILGLTPNQQVDYGTFIWLELNKADFQRLIKSSVPFSEQPDAGQVKLRGYIIDPMVTPNPVYPAAYAAASVGGPSLHLVKFIGPTQTSWLESLEASGLTVLQYYPNFTYQVWGNLTPAEAAILPGFVSWTQPFLPAYKPGPGVTEAVGTLNNLAVTFYNSGNPLLVIDQINKLGGKHIQYYPAQSDGKFYTAIYSFDSASLPALAGIPEIWAIEFSSDKPGFDDEISSQIVAGNYSGTPAQASTGYFTWLTSLGLDGTGVTWADIDTGLVGTHPDIAGRTVSYVTYAGAPAANTDADGHGSHTAGTIFGDPRTINGGSGLLDGAGFYWGVGIAPRAGMVIQNALSGTSWPPTGGWQQLSKDSLTNGAVGSNNSWFTGAAGAQGYSAAARTHDLMVRDGNFDTVAAAEPLIMVFSAGNAGPNASTITEPKEAKNLIVVGASDNYPRAGASINGLGSFSSRGPALDGRILPNVVAPGVNTTSWRGTGASSCSASGVGGAADALYSYCTGTSMAAPQVSGAAALIVQWWKLANAGIVPSPAMVKALLINNAVDMVGGANVGATIPNNNQGWGRINLGNVFGTSVAKVFHDQDHTIVATGEEVLYNLSVFNPSEPVKISLVWSDAPGAIGVSPSLVNNLDLRVVNNANTYLGNVMTSGWSTTGGAADALNNIENVYIQNPGATLQIYVTATNIAGDGIPYNGDTTDQDFALVCTNCTATPDYSLVISPAAQQICIGSNAIFTVTTTSLIGYTDFVTLSAGGEPGGTTKNFSVNPVTPGNNSILTIGNTAGAASGMYAILVSGASTSGSHNDISNLTLVSLNDTPTLSTPPNGHKHAPLQPALSWTAVTGAASYDIQIATDSGFNNIVDSAVGIAATSYSPAGQLTSNTLYYWRVRANNTCGAASYSSSNHFVTFNTNASAVSYCNNTPANIPDNSTNGVFSQITIPDSGTIVDMDVVISGTHSWVGDLGFTLSDVLINPSTPISVTVIDRPGFTNTGFGCGGNNFNVILSDEAATSVETTCSATPPALQGTVKPNNPLSNFDGKPVTGNWRIKAVDFAAPDAGIMQKWCINITLASSIVYAHQTDATCGGNTPCFSGSGAIQQAINAVSDDGIVNVLGNQTISSPLTCVKNVIISGSPDMTSSITWTGGAGSLFVAETGCSLTVKGLAIDGADVTSAFTANGAAAITAYANNFSNIIGAYTGSGTPEIGHNYWGTNAADAAAPVGMPVGEWPKRLGTPAQKWGDGQGSATVTSASLSGGTGTAVIVDLGTTPPFGNGVSGFSDKMCSPYFDFFLLNGSGTWTASIPVAGGTNCTDNTLTPKRLYTIGEISNCTPTTNGACWSGIPPASLTTVTNNLVYSGLTSAMLNGTYFVAGSEAGTDPTSIKLRSFSGRDVNLTIFTFGGLLLLTALATISSLIWRKNQAR